jgi:predicted RNase H-like HicB family nuclease
LSFQITRNCIDSIAAARCDGVVRQRFHSIIKPHANGVFVGWVEEIPGTITQGRSLDECRRNLRDSLMLMVTTHRDEARLGLDPSCIQESIEIDDADLYGLEQLQA